MSRPCGGALFGSTGRLGVDPVERGIEAGLEESAPGDADSN